MGDLTRPPGFFRGHRWRYQRWLVVFVFLIGVVFAVIFGVREWGRIRVESAWKDVQDSLAGHDLTPAAVALNHYLTLRPDDAAAWFQASRIARRQGNFPEAKRFLARFEDLGGASADIRLERDLLLVQQGLIVGVDQRLRASVGPEHPDVRFVLEALARGYILIEKWADARQACELWRAVEPDAPQAWLWGGFVCERMVQVDQAAEFYLHALELDPDDRDSHLSYARILVRQRNPAGALPHYEWVLARHPDNADALLGLAQCRIDGGQFEEALPSIDRVLHLHPSSNLAMALRGRVAMEGGDPAGAEKWLRQAFTAEPSDAETLYLLIRCLRSENKNEEADLLAGRLEALQKDLRQLTELLRQIGPRLADAGPCCEAGVIALRIGRTQQGLNLLQDGLRRPGDHRPIHAALARHYRESDQLDLAEVHLKLSEKP